MQSQKKFSMELGRGGYKDIHYNYDDRYPFPTPFKVTLDGVVLGQIKGGVPTEYQHPDWRWEPINLIITGGSILNKRTDSLTFFNNALTLKFQPKKQNVIISLVPDDINPRLANYDIGNISPVEAPECDVAFEFYKAYNDIILDAAKYGLSPTLSYLEKFFREYILGEADIVKLFERYNVPLAIKF